MALANTPTLLSLDEFASLMGINPWAFNQLDINALLGDQVHTCAPWYQYDWQKAQTLSRETIAQAISDAEGMLAEQLTYWPAPKFVSGEAILYPRPNTPESWSSWWNARWKLKDVKTHYGRMISPGVEAFQTIDASAAITLSDSDGDSKDDTFSTAAIAIPGGVSVTDAGEIAVYVADADRPGFIDGEEAIWRIRPVKIVLDTAANTVTISGPLWLIVDPDKTLNPAPELLDPTDAANFLTQVKVMRRYVDQSQQGKVVLEQTPCSAPPCVTVEVDACFGERNSEQGIVTPTATGSEPTAFSGCQTCNYAPDFVRIHYCSGYPLVSDRLYRMDPLHAQMVARLAVTLLAEHSCVECSNTQIDYWRSLPGDFKNQTERIMTESEINNPFGPRNGAVWAWKRVYERAGRKMAGAII